MTLPKSRTFPVKLQSAFHFTSEEEKEVLIQAIRLYVLYEDLKIELEGAQEEHIPVLEGTSRETRRFYFVRRTFGTLLEISGAMQAAGGQKRVP